MIYTHVAAALAALAIGFVTAWQVQGWRYDGQIAQREQEIAQAAQAAEAAARLREQQLQQRADEVARNAAQRQTVLAARAATADRVARSLRDDIAQLNARPAPVDPTAAAYADDAARARQLLGACTDEYRGVAQAADQLRDQVTGLQDYARTVSSRP